jgi:hypothetical protein
LEIVFIVSGVIVIGLLAVAYFSQNGKAHFSLERVESGRPTNWTTLFPGLLAVAYFRIKAHKKTSTM